MRCPILKELPDPPQGKNGWPWTEESPQLPDEMSDGKPWPKISIVTPSFNQGQFIEETIRSVLLQGYPDLEYIIVDGKSTDNSIKIIEKYSHWLHHWISETDLGQSHAINKGFMKAGGTLFAYINSDDLYEPNALAEIAAAFTERSSPDLVAGICTVFDEKGIKRVFYPIWPDDLSDYVKTTFSSTFGQPAAFWTRDIYRKIGGLDQSLSFCFDREFFLKVGLAGGKTKMILKNIARFREHISSKSLSQVVRFHEESITILKRYGDKLCLSLREQRKCERVMLNEIAYQETFSIWKHKGRLYALLMFFRMIATSPDILFQRKILGQMRRLLFFKKIDVAELQ